ncbi:MAG: ABC transporter ATP-binding protein [Candidatus Hermodarchaeota archaeon]
MSKPIIQMKNVTKIFDNEVVALSNINMEIYEGITGFVGPNGAGKTTALKLLMGQAKPNIGTVRVLDRDPFMDIELHREVVIINEFTNLKSLNFMRVETFLKNFGAIGHSKQEASKNAEKALRTVSLADAKRKQIGTLSKGMRQRLKIAYALTINPHPRLILADEPLSGVDPLGRQEIFDLFKGLNRDFGTSTFIASHLLFEVDPIASNGIVLIHNGKIVASGLTKQIRELLSDYPYRFRIICGKDKGKVLAKHLLDEELVTAIDISSNETTDIVEIATDTPQRLYNFIPDVFLNPELQIRNFVNLEEEIATEKIFDYLLR